MKINKHDALAYLLMTIYYADVDKKGDWKSSNEKALLEQIQIAEKVDLSFDVANKFIESVKNKKGISDTTAYEITGRCSRQWILRVSGYMHMMAQASKSKDGNLYSIEEFEGCKKFDNYFNIDLDKEDPFLAALKWFKK